jgi:putative ABC transport system substrate-binding protein
VKRFLAFLAALALIVQSVSAEAQSTGKIHRIGWLASGSSAASLRFFEAFKDGLREAGWIEGQNITIDSRYAEGKSDRYPALAAELVQLKVDVIATVTTPAGLAAKNATSVIPIVMMNVAQPVELGLIASFGRPGGNVTGISWPDLEIFGKEIALLKELVPNVRLVAILSNPTNPAHGFVIKKVKAAAGSLGLELRLVEASKLEQLDGAFAAMVKERADAVLVVADGLFGLHRKRLAELAARNRLPATYGLSENVEAGGLMSYGPNRLAAYRRGAFLVDKILRGAKPADLPVEQPTKYDLVINLMTAKALGLTIPPSVLLRADQVIQ